MASAKLQKPTNQTSSHSNEEHNLSKKISEMTTKVFGHKHHEHQEVAKHCSTCQCPAAQKNTMPVYKDQTQKKEHVNTTSIKNTKSAACVETKKKEKEGHTSKAHKDAKHTTCVELRKDKQHAKIPTTKESKQPASAEMRKNEIKEQHTKSNTTNASNRLIKKEQKDKQTSHYFSNMTDHLKEKIMMMKKTKDTKSKYSSSSSDSDSDSCSEDDVGGEKKKNKRHGKESKPASK
ncbi:uncharacterized protein LOC141653647 [Silene latifolia]|uniref:uncharacterized protein LOC141653647 n=1 Tax=Silene latifolia TaxID=37657 RepID=UPI003D776A21